MYTLDKYGSTRYWAVYDPSDELVCVTVYKRGAREVADRLNASLQNSSTARGLRQ